MSNIGSYGINGCKIRALLNEHKREYNQDLKMLHTIAMISKLWLSTTGIIAKSIFRVKYVDITSFFYMHDNLVKISADLATFLKTTNTPALEDTV